LKNSYKIAVSGVCTDLSVVLMFLGSMLYVFSYAVPVMLGLLMMMLHKTFGKKCAFITFFSVSLLSLILVAEKEGVLLYILFFGYYPVIKPRLDLLKSGLLRALCKICLFNAALISAELLAYYAFRIPFFEGSGSHALFAAVFTGAMNIIFILYEFMLNSYYTLYVNRLEPKIKKMFK